MCPPSSIKNLQKYYLTLYHYHSPSSRNIRITLRSKQSNYFSSSLLLTLLTRIPAQKIFFIFLCNTKFQHPFFHHLPNYPPSSRPVLRQIRTLCPQPHSYIKAWDSPLKPCIFYRCSTFWCHFAKGTPYCGVPMFYPKGFRDFSLTGTAFCPGYPKCVSGRRHF